MKEAVRVRNGRPGNRHGVMGVSLLPGPRSCNVFTDTGAEATCADSLLGHGKRN